MELESAEPVVGGLMGVAKLRLSRWLGRLSALSLASPALLAAFEILTNMWSNSTWLTVWRTSLLAGVGGSLAFAFVGVLIGASRTARDGTLRVEGADVVMKTETATRRVPLASITSGVVVPSGSAARVELQLASGDRLFADVRNIAEGQRALAALGLDVSKRRCTIPLASRAATTLKRVGYVTLALMTSLGVLGSVTHGARPTELSMGVWLASTALAISFAVWATRPRDITIGADGVLLKERVGSRFFRFEEIRDVRANGRTVELHLSDERVESITLPRGSSSDTAAAIALRVAEAIRARGAAPDEESALHLLMRAGRSLKDWRGALAKLVQRAAGYRETALSTDDLAAILANPKSTTEHRIGAALALAELGGPERQGQIRIAADACAGERMRVALTKLADGDSAERAVEEALAESADDDTVTSADENRAAG